MSEGNSAQVPDDGEKCSACCHATVNGHRDPDCKTVIAATGVLCKDILKWYMNKQLLIGIFPTWNSNTNSFSLGHVLWCSVCARAIEEKQVTQYQFSSRSYADSLVSALNNSNMWDRGKSHVFDKHV
jgi:predicted nucleic acid-binding Zn ribbon protein